MNIITRRSFMKRSSLAAMGMAMGSLMNVPGFIRNAVAQENQYSWNGKKVLFLFLRGGNDALNMLVPTGDSAYYTAGVRDTLAIPAPTDPLQDLPEPQCPETPEPNVGIDLGNGFATMHPSMIDMCDVYNAGELAMIHRVGYPNQSRSHFDSERYWETGVPRDDMLQEGIFYRTMVETGLHESQVLPAVSLQDTMPLMLKGALPMANINNPERYDLLGVYAAARQKHIDSISRIHGQNYPHKKNREILFPTGERFVNSIQAIQSIDFQDNDSAVYLDGDGTHLFPIDSASDDKLFDSGSAFNFFRSLKYSAQILSTTDAVVSGTELNGFDTHNNQGDDMGGLNGGHADRMAWIGWAMHALKRYFTNLGMWDDMVVVTLSEFGRTTIENGSYGTDHAEAGAMIVAGGGVNGGVYQCSPSDAYAPWAPGLPGTMFEVNSRYLSRAVDYRSVLGEIIREHLGTSQDQLGRIIPGYANAAESLLTPGMSIDGTSIVGELGLFGS